jgi:pimeloyl-ACP methyl ester carboxylesterase
MGNASLGLDWLDLLDSYTRQADTTSSAAQTGFLLVDYPGYGLCQGKPSRQSIRESSEGAFQALAQELKLEPERLEQDLNVLGLSIGTAAGLEFASRHPIQHIILLAPFTSLLDIARRSVGSPLCYLLYDRFDNEQRIRELTRRATAPRIDIFHGSADTLVPPRMGQALAQLSPEHARFHPVEGADHNMILFAAEERVVELMLGAPGEGLSEGRIAEPK